MSISDRRRRTKLSPIEPVAGNGLLDRRALLGRGVVFAGAMSTGAFGSATGAAAEPVTDAPWSLEPGHDHQGLRATFAVRERRCANIEQSKWPDGGPGGACTAPSDA